MSSTTYGTTREPSEDGTTVRFWSVMQDLGALAAVVVSDDLRGCIVGDFSVGAFRPFVGGVQLTAGVLTDAIAWSARHVGDPGLRVRGGVHVSLTLRMPDPPPVVQRGTVAFVVVK